MRWTKKEREAIEKQIKEYERKIENTRCKRRCVFCLEFNLIGHLYCDSCPNIKINSILDVKKNKDINGEDFSPYLDCVNNASYFQERFNLDTRRQFKGFDLNMERLRFRRRMWQDSLDLTKREFVKKYKKEE